MFDYDDYDDEEEEMDANRSQDDEEDDEEDENDADAVAVVAQEAPLEARLRRAPKTSKVEVSIRYNKECGCTISYTVFV